MYRLVQESGHLASLHWLSLVFVPCLLLFYTRAVYAVVLCLYVCLSVTAVVLSKRWIVRCVNRKFGYLQNNDTCFWHFSQTVDLENISPLPVDRRKCCQLSSSDDRSHFITLSVDLSVQRNGHEAARRAGPCATAEMCF